jgi:hypothetical protein
MWNDYELGWEDLPEQEEIEFVNKVSNMFNKTIKKLYNSYSGRVLKEELNESAFFQRRIPLDKVENLLRDYTPQVFNETESYDQFKYELTLKAVEWIMWDEYKMGWDELPEQEEIEFVTEVSDMFNKTIKKLYNSYSGRILKEEISQKGKDKLINMIKRIGVEKTAKSVGEVNNLYEILNINSPMEFLHLFDDLEQVQSEMDPNLTLFRYKPKNNLIIYDRKNKIVYINFEEIWQHLLEAGLFNFDIKELIKEWLSSVYNIRGVKPRDSSGFVDAARVV